MSRTTTTKFENRVISTPLSSDGQKSIILNISRNFKIFGSWRHQFRDSGKSGRDPWIANAIHNVDTIVPLSFGLLLRPLW